MVRNGKKISYLKLDLFQHYTYDVEGNTYNMEGWLKLAAGIVLVQKGVRWYENVNIIGTLKGCETW